MAEAMLTLEELSDQELLDIPRKQFNKLIKGKPKEEVDAFRARRKNQSRKLDAERTRLGRRLVRERETAATFNAPPCPDWRSVSVRHRQKFENLLRMWREGPISLTFINGNGVCFQEQFFIGGGSCGTEVYICLGRDGVERAIKRLPIRFSQKLLTNERDILLTPNAVESPRIVNYFFYDDTTNSDFCYLILNLYERNLKEYVTEEHETITESISRKMIRQVLEGLKALHGRTPRILHRDLKPTNILVDVNGDLVLSDFGIGRFLPEEGSTHLTNNESGSKGWVAYECIDWSKVRSPSAKSTDAKQLKWKEKSDIQVTGILAFYILTKGEHPFGGEAFQLLNLMRNNPVGVRKLKDPVVKELLSRMLNRDLDKRPYVEQALKHPYFLSAKKQMELVQAVGNQIEVKKPKAHPNCIVVQLLDNLDPRLHRSPLLPPDWKAEIHPVDLNALCQGGGDPSKLDGGRYTHCLRLLRNVFQHWGDQPRSPLYDMRQATCLEEYFLQIFPTLSVVLHKMIRNLDDWKTRPALKEFFPVIERRTGAS